MKLAAELEALKATAVLPEPTTRTRRPPCRRLTRRSRRRRRSSSRSSSDIDESGSAPVIVADYAQMLTGAEAAAAASAAGDESPPPNDYYIVNANKALRKLKVKPGISVNVATNDDGTSDPNGHTVTFAELGRQLRRTHCRERGYPHGTVLDLGQGWHRHQDQAAVSAVARSCARVSGASSGRSPSPCVRPS